MKQFDGELSENPFADSYRTGFFSSGRTCVEFWRLRTITHSWSMLEDLSRKQKTSYCHRLTKQTVPHRSMRRLTSNRKLSAATRECSSPNIQYTSHSYDRPLFWFCTIDPQTLDRCVRHCCLFMCMICDSGSYHRLFKLEYLLLLTTIAIFAILAVLTKSRNGDIPNISDTFLGVPIIWTKV